MKKLANASLALLAASMLALAGVQAGAQSPSGAKVQAPTVPDLVARAYRWGDFDELERLYALYGKPGVRSELTGTARVEHFWMGINQISASGLRVTDEYYQQLDALTARWAREHPQSVLAQLLHAEALETHAWVHRGNGYARTVSPEGWAGFRKHLAAAAAQLQRTEALAAHDSSWNALMLTVGRGMEWDRDRLMAVFESGIAKNPDHDALYFLMQETLLPKWGGDVETVERFIALAVKNTRDKRGMEMYARLYAGLSYSELNQSLFTASRASWASMKAGFEDRLKRYPHADNRNMYAYFACMANDRQTLQEQLELIGDKFEPAFWGDRPERNFEACKRLAAQM